MIHVSYVGDFNVIQDQNLDSFNYLHVNNPRAKECILSIKEEFNLVDPFRELYEFERKYTWRKPNPLKQARLDYFLVTQNFMPSILSHKILPSYRSDHSTIVITFQINDFTRGRGLWKFNNSLLKDKDYVKEVKNCIQNLKQQYMIPVYNLEYILSNENDLQLTISDHLFLETLLMEIRGKTISYSSYKKKQNQQKEEKLEKEIEQMEELEHIDTEMIKNKKLELENLRKERIQGIMIRAKIKWAEEGEKSTKYFCSLEPRNYINKTVPKIQTDDGNIIQEQQDILKEIKHFYSYLYKGKERSQETDYQEILNTLDHPILTQLERSKIEGEITEDEIAHVLKNMKNNKSPGSDGFTVEFFKFFFKDLKTFIKRGINEGY